MTEYAHRHGLRAAALYGASREAMATDKTCLKDVRGLPLGGDLETEKTWALLPGFLASEGGLSVLPSVSGLGRA